MAQRGGGSTGAGEVTQYVDKTKRQVEFTKNQYKLFAFFSHPSSSSSLGDLWWVFF
jgi:hypothetical protein